MDALLSAAGTRLLDLGLSGIVILGLVWFIWQLLKELQKEREARINTLLLCIKAETAHQVSLDAAVELVLQQQGTRP